MRELDPSGTKELAFALLKAVKRSGLTQAEMREQLPQRYAVDITVSGLSHSINRGTIRLQWA